MGAKMQWYFILALTALVFGATGVVAQDQDCKKLTQNRNVVEVSVDGERRIGSGVLLTFEGHVITAAHLMNEIRDPPLLRAHVRLHGAAKFGSAKILRIDERLDIALLRMEDAVPNFRPIAAAVENDVRKGSNVELCLSGFPIHKDAMGAQKEEKFSSVKTPYLGDRLGYLFTKWAAEDGFSGGAAFLNGELAGMILRRKTPSGTFILPIDQIEAMVDEGGVELGANRQFEPGLAASQMNQIVTNNTELIKKNKNLINVILRSVEWKMIVRGTKAPELKLVLTPKRALPVQIVDGIMILKIYAHFKNENFKEFVKTHTPIYDTVAKDIPKSGRVVVKDLMARIESQRKIYTYDKNIDVINSPLLYLHIKASVRGGAGGYSVELPSIESNIPLNENAENQR